MIQFWFCELLILLPMPSSTKKFLLAVFKFLQDIDETVYKKITVVYSEAGEASTMKPLAKILKELPTVN